MCGHSRLDHQEESEVGHCDACYDGAPEKRLSKAWIHAFVPADAETAGEPEDLPLCRSCGKRVETWFDRSVCAEPCESMHDRCSACGVTVTPCPNMSEPEAPECGVSDACTYDKESCGKACQGVLDAVRRAVQAPARPPFLVAYATGSGALIELALPGEASVAVVDGSLVISHASGVLGIQHVRPLESA